MTLKIETTPWDFLFNQSWECDNLKDFIREHGISKEAFNMAVEEMCGRDSTMTETELNDILKFNDDEIIEYLGGEDA